MNLSFLLLIVIFVCCLSIRYSTSPVIFELEEAPSAIQIDSLERTLKGYEQHVSFFQGDYRSFGSTKFLNLKIDWQFPQTYGIYKQKGTNNREKANQYNIKIFAQPAKENTKYSSFDKGLLILELIGKKGEKGWTYKGYQESLATTSQEDYNKAFDSQKCESCFFNTDATIEEFNEKFFCDREEFGSTCNVANLILPGSIFGKYFSSSETIYNVIISLSHSNAKETMPRTTTSSFKLNPSTLKMNDVLPSKFKSLEKEYGIDASELLKNKSLMFTQKDGNYLTVNKSSTSPLIFEGKLNHKQTWDGIYVFTFIKNDKEFGYLTAGGRYLKADFVNESYELVEKSLATKINVMTDLKGSQQIDIQFGEYNKSENKGFFSVNLNLQFNVPEVRVCWQPNMTNIVDKDRLHCGIHEQLIGGTLTKSNIFTESNKPWKLYAKSPLKSFPQNILSIKLLEQIPKSDTQHEAQIRINEFSGRYDGNLFYFTHSNGDEYYGRTKHIALTSRSRRRRSRSRTYYNNRLQIIKADSNDNKYIEFTQ